MLIYFYHIALFVVILGDSEVTINLKCILNPLDFLLRSKQ